MLSEISCMSQCLSVITKIITKLSENGEIFQISRLLIKEEASTIIRFYKPLEDMILREVRK